MCVFPRNVPNGAGRNGVPERSERRSPGSRPASRATEIEVAGTPQKDTLPEKIEKPPVAALHRTSPTPPPSSTSSPSPPSRARSSIRRSAAHRLPLRLHSKRMSLPLRLHSKRTSLVLELATRGFLVTSKMGVRSTTSPSSNVQVTRTRTDSSIQHVTDTYSTMRVTRSSVHKPNLVADGSNQGYSSEEDILPGGPLLEINEMPQPTASDVAARWINIYHVGVCR